MFYLPLLCSIGFLGILKIETHFRILLLQLIYGIIKFFNFLMLMLNLILHVHCILIFEFHVFDYLNVLLTQILSNLLRLDKFLLIRLGQLGDEIVPASRLSVLSLLSLELYLEILDHFIQFCNILMQIIL